MAAGKAPRNGGCCPIDWAEVCKNILKRFGEMAYATGTNDESLFCLVCGVCLGEIVGIDGGKAHKYYQFVC